MTERSVSQQVLTDMAAASSNNLPFQNSPSCSPPTSQPARSAGGLRSTASHQGLDQTPALSACLPVCLSVCLSGGRCPAGESERQDEWEWLTVNFAHFNVDRVPLIATHPITLSITTPLPLHSLLPSGAVV